MAAASFPPGCHTHQGALVTERKPFVMSVIKGGWIFSIACSSLWRNNIYGQDIYCQYLLPRFPPAITRNFFLDSMSEKTIEFVNNWLSLLLGRNAGPKQSN